MILIELLSLTQMYSPLTFTTLWANSAVDKLTIHVFFFYFSQKTGSNISCKLSHIETICMKCQSLFSVKNKENISKCHLLNFYQAPDFFFCFYW